MRPALIYRATTHQVETVALKGIPLGGPGGDSVHQDEGSALPGRYGDVHERRVPELFSEMKEMLGYGKAIAIFEEVPDRDHRTFQTGWR